MLYTVQYRILYVCEAGGGQAGGRQTGRGEGHARAHTRKVRRSKREERVCVCEVGREEVLDLSDALGLILSTWTKEKLVL